MSDEAELARLRRLLAARDGKPGWRANCEQIRRQIAEVERRVASRVTETAETTTVFDGIMAGLNEALDHAKAQ